MGQHCCVDFFEKISFKPHLYSQLLGRLRQEGCVLTVERVQGQAGQFSEAYCKVKNKTGQRDGKGLPSHFSPH